MDAALIGVCRDAVVRNAHSHPNCSFLGIALTDHFHNPNFIGIGNGEGFPFRGVTILGHEVGHHLDGFTCGLGTLQTEGHQRNVVDTAFLLLRPQLFASAESGFGDSHLIFVDVAHHVVSNGSFRNFAEVVMRVAIDDATHRAGGVCAGRIVYQTSIHAPRVSAVRNEAFAVF